MIASHHGYTMIAGERCQRCDHPTEHHTHWPGCIASLQARLKLSETEVERMVRVNETLRRAGMDDE
jgi:hypothetical protein